VSSWECGHIEAERIIDKALSVVLCWPCLLSQLVVWWIEKLRKFNLQPLVSLILERVNR